MNRQIRIGLVQMQMHADRDRNLQKAEEMIKKAADKELQIICLPELFSSPYFPQYIGRETCQYADTVPGVITDRFVSIARSYRVVIILPIYQKEEDGRCFNSAVVIDTDGYIYPPYHKVHIPQDPKFYEKGYFFPGDEYLVYHTKVAKIAVLICYDQWFPEAARSVALAGSEIIFYPTAIGHIGGEIPGEGNWRDSWEVIQRSHAIANSIPVAAVNRVGWEDDIEFFGGSFICDAFGKVLSRAGDGEELVSATLDLNRNEEIRNAWGFFRNRRPDTYESVGRLSFSDGLSIIPGDTPRSRGYHMPAEWEPHDAVWLAWPRSELTFPRLAAARETYINLIKALAPYEKVELLVPDKAVLDSVKDRLIRSGVPIANVNLHLHDYADIWMRDYGPTFVKNPALRSIAMVRWEFNAWGLKYDDLIRDREVPGVINSWLSLPMFQAGIVLEGGSIEVNGQGCVLTTSSCLLNKNRNPDLSKDKIERILLEYLGATKVIWLNKGIAGDDTDGHIDDIARFVSPTTVVCAVEEDPEDQNYQALIENYQILCNETSQDERPLRVIRLPMPTWTSFQGRYPASYTNFFIGNLTVVVPIFQHKNDQVALDILRDLFPGRLIIGIDATALVEGNGTFHCGTQQQPQV